MALLFMDGFDAGDLKSKWIFLGNNMNDSAPDSFTRFGVGRSARFAWMDSTAGRNITPSSVVFVGAAMATSTASNVAVIRLYGDGGATVHLRIEYAVSQIRVWRGDKTTLIASAAIASNVNVFDYVEVKATIDDAAGRVIVRRNGAVVIDFTGDTRNAGTASVFDRISIDGEATAYFDDLYVCNDQGTANNDFLGDVRVQTLVPTGPGASTALTPSAGANWSCVDELPYSATDYVSGSTAGNRDTYATADLPDSTSSVKAVQVNAIAKKTDAGSRSLKTALRSGGTDYAGTATVLTTSDAVVSTLRETNPATSAAWTVADVNATEIGVEVA